MSARLRITELTAHGIPAGLLLRPLVFYRTPSGKSLHSATDCSHLTGRGRRSAGVHRQSLIGVNEDRLCSKCFKITDPEVSDYLDVARHFRSAEKLFAEAGGDSSHQAKLQRLIAVCTKVRRCEHLEALRDLADELAERAGALIDADTSSFVERAARRCGIELLSGGRGRGWGTLLSIEIPGERPALDAGGYHHPTVDAAFATWMRLQIAGAEVGAARGGAVEAGVAARSDVPESFAQIPFQQRYRGEDYPSLREWAAAEWRAAHDEELVELVTAWQDALDERRDRPDVIALFTGWDPTSVACEAVVAAAGAELHSSGTVAFARLPGVVFDWLSSSAHVARNFPRWRRSVSDGRLPITLIDEAQDGDGDDVLTIAVKLLDEGDGTAAQALATARLLTS